MYQKILAIFAVLIFTAAFAGCAKTVETTPSASTSSSAPQASSASSPTSAPASSASVSPSPAASASAGDNQEKTVTDFETLLKTAGNEKAAIAELKAKLPGLTAANAARMVLDFETYQNDVVMKGTAFGDDLVKLIQASAAEPYNEKKLNDLSAVQGAALKTALQALFDRGYKIVIPEGNYQAIINYDGYKSFENYLPPDISAYIEIMAAESGNRMAEDGGIIIPIHDVYTRARLTESFLQAFPESVKADQIANKYNGYIDAYFFGLNNTPAFDYQTKQLDQEFLDSYRKVAADSTNSPLARAVSDYLKVLMDNGYKLTNAVDNYRNSIIHTLKGTES